MIALQLNAQLPRQGPRITSFEMHPDRTVTFLISAPQAKKVKFVSPDINNKEMVNKGSMRKDPNNFWETTVGPLDAGAYRYNFNVDGISVVDPENSAVSELNTHVISIVIVP